MPVRSGVEGKLKDKKQKAKPRKSRKVEAFSGLGAELGEIFSRHGLTSEIPTLSSNPFPSIHSTEGQKKRFFELAERLQYSRNKTEIKKVKVELGHMIFGGELHSRGKM